MNETFHMQIPGEFWIRTLDGNKETANVVLSAVYEKYAANYPTFYSELTSNQITRFDTFYDCIFVETKSGCIFEKLQIDNNQIKPFNQANLHKPKFDPVPGYLTFDTYVDYWFDEETNKIYYSYLSALEENKNFNTQFSFVFLVDVFDCNTATRKTVIFDKVVFVYEGYRDWDIYNYVMENPKLTYNSDTKKFNLSFLLKNASRELGLISLNFIQTDAAEQSHYEVTEVNGYLPFFNLKIKDCYVIPYDPNIVQPYHVLTIATERNDPAYNLKYIIITPNIDGDDIEDYYLVIE